MRICACMPGTVLSTVHRLLYLIFTVLWDFHYYWYNFTDGETDNMRNAKKVVPTSANWYLAEPGFYQFWIFLTPNLTLIIFFLWPSETKALISSKSWHFQISTIPCISYKMDYFMYVYKTPPKPKKLPSNCDMPFILGLSLPHKM